jgi:spore coat protein U-like protein
VKRCLEFAVLAVALAALPARAISTCSGSNVSLPFGAYDTLSTQPTDSQSDFLITCTRDGGPANVTLAISLGTSATSGTVTSRQMRRTGGTERLAYNLFREPARANAWGQTFGVDTVSRVINVPNKGSNTIAITLFGRIAAGQDVPVGTYTDSLVITVSY